MKYDLSVLIAARNEEFLSRTVEGVLKNKRGLTEVIVVCDGNWPDPPVTDHRDVTLVYHATPIGQRAAVNEAANVSRAKYVMKLDAHCIVDEGFDVKMMRDMQDDMTMVPAMYNLHAFNWRCTKCGNEWYQGPTPRFCNDPGEKRTKNKACDSTKFERVMVWKPRLSRRNEFYRFDTTLHFQYHGARKKHPEAMLDVAETLSLQGSCFMMTRKKYWELGVCDEAFGSWGQQGTEVALKTWLSGGRVVVNKKTWYSHLFRTQGGDFNFPYPQNGRQIEHARQYSRELFLYNRWPKQKHPLSWLIDKFKPLPDWHDPKGKKMLDLINKEGEKFMKPTKGIVYYTDNQLTLKIAHPCKKQIKSIGLPIVSASLKPMPDMGKNIHIKMERGYMAYFTQILKAIEASEAKYIFFCEHDWLYHPSHFEFTPPRDDTYYYNLNWWRLRASDGHCLYYDSKLLPSICASRELLLQHYQKRMERLLAGENSTKDILGMGFEPGTHNREQRIDDYKSDVWRSKYPNIDIRHTTNLSATRWKKSQFRNQKYTQGWTEKKCFDIEGWDWSGFGFIGTWVVLR